MRISEGAAGQQGGHIVRGRASSLYTIITQAGFGFRVRLSAEAWFTAANDLSGWHSTPRAAIFPIAGLPRYRRRPEAGRPPRFPCWGPPAENPHWLVSYDIAQRHLGPPSPQPGHEPSPLAFADPDYVLSVLAAAGFAEIERRVGPPDDHRRQPEDEARRALTMGPTARLIEEKQPDEATRQTIAREIEEAFAAEAGSGAIRLPATVFLVTARRPG
jgi:hypothetical protein